MFCLGHTEFFVFLFYDLHSFLVAVLVFSSDAGQDLVFRIPLVLLVLSSASCFPVAVHRWARSRRRHSFCSSLFHGFGSCLSARDLLCTEAFFPPFIFLLVPTSSVVLICRAVRQVPSGFSCPQRSFFPPPSDFSTHAWVPFSRLDFCSAGCPPGFLAS
jgi:hypothetical protein